ncbi:MAG: site-specific integrase [Planctomycetota bacterium]|nr:site-specific integrase [Planctomycetota bacterium]
MTLVWGDSHKSELTFRQAVKGYLADAERGMKPSTFRQQKYRLRKILELVAWADKSTSSITATDIQRFISFRLKGSAPSTCNRDVSSFRSVFEWAQRMGHCTSTNPVKDIRLLSEKGRERKMYLTISESATFLRACQDEGDVLVHDFMTVALRTGCRRGELLSLEWRDVLLDRAEMTIRACNSKSSKDRTIPLGKTVIETFRRLRAREKVIQVDGSGRVFMENCKPLHVVRLQRTFERIRQRLSKGKGLVPEKLNEFVIHSLRHTFATLGLQAGASLWVMQKLLGHSNPAMTASLYGHHSASAARPSVDLLDAALDGGGVEEKKGSSASGA